MLKTILAVLLLGLAIYSWGLNSRSTTATLPMTSPSQAPAIVIGEPKIIRIPKLEVNAVIEPVGEDADGRMAAPSLPETVAWWQRGAMPGELGKSVLAGHLDAPDGSPGVFYNLEKLKEGDTIEITDSYDQSYTFKVFDIKTYTDAAFPIKEVFGKSDQILLNLITCAGTFDRGARNYQDRLVIYSRLISE